ncbi:conserved hypothetical protein [Talaromyces stipitatus ATCC 10500]|uniref:MULE transposase domain-containing protein n=1 Tax=Talaromyces stipitatus (strain ATCC 10500 / CBS 375.48 / QM 6759 / NRRL 1006) TaxID=441959 RepID=B8MFB9_TALSN|nr:uncharacterized protein TSTA_017280 [Talaromyces stipitatus ATCC 10500]EED16653.1 conserved hypothetical protein [Talaromyces stipitatus ATCC 10500]
MPISSSLGLGPIDRNSLTEFPSNMRLPVWDGGALFTMTSRLVDYESSEDGVEPLPEPSPPKEPCEPHTRIPAPSTDQTFKTQDAAMKFLNSFTKTYEYALITKRSKMPKEGGPIHRVYLQYSRGGVYRERTNEKTRVREISTQCIGCPFRLILRHDKHADCWCLDLTDPRHNYHLATGSTLALLRHEEIESKETQIKSYLDLKMSTNQILSTLYKDNPESIIKPRDIYNKKRKLRDDFLDGKTPVQALISVVPDNGDWIINYGTSDTNILLAIFYMHKTSLEMLCQNPNVLFMDCTYKTNQYKIPLLDIVGCTACNKTFYAGFSFMLDEKEESYKFILECLAEVYAQANLPLPICILTDKDMALMNAIPTVFPMSNNIICLWHIEKNILTHVRPILTNEVLHIIYSGDPAAAKKDVTQYKTHIESKWRNFFGSFNKIVYAKTKEEKDEAVNAFKAEYSSDIWQEVMDYINSEWLNDDITQRFLHCHLLDVKHFGQLITSQNESAHWTLKRDLQTYEDDKVLKMKNDFLGPTKKPFNPECSGITKRTTGIPCIHIIKHYIDSEEPLQLYHFYQHWRLYSSKELPPIDPHTIVLNLAVVQGRGRPRGSINHLIASQAISIQDSSTRRELSAFEHVIAQGNLNTGSRGRRGRGRGGRGGYSSQARAESIVANSRTASRGMVSQDATATASQIASEGPVRRSQRRGRGQSARWLGDENELPGY